MKIKFSYRNETTDYNSTINNLYDWKSMEVLNKTGAQCPAKVCAILNR